MNHPHAFAAYYLPFPKKGHQLDLLAQYLDNDQAVADPADWPECSKRIHGWHNDEAYFMCMHADCALREKRVQPQDCENCPVRCGRE